MTNLHSKHSWNVLLFVALCAGPGLANGFAQSRAQSQTSTICRFSAGPRAGQTQDYAPLAPNIVGAACTDNAGSTGTIVAPGTGGTAARGNVPQTSTLCRFSSGPRAGQTQDYAPLTPNLVGAYCTDNLGSTGAIVAGEATSSAPAAGSRGGGAKPEALLCRYTTGPRSGLTLDYTSSSPVSIGAPCGDNQGSAGTVISANGGPSSGSPAVSANPVQGMSRNPVQGASNPIVVRGTSISPVAPSGRGNNPATAETAVLKSTLCGLTSGPKAGRIEDYAPQDAVPVGTACSDGNGSFGNVVAAAIGVRP